MRTSLHVLTNLHMDQRKALPFPSEPHPGDGEGGVLPLIPPWVLAHARPCPLRMSYDQRYLGFQRNMVRVCCVYLFRAMPLSSVAPRLQGQGLAPGLCAHQVFDELLGTD